MVWGNLIAELVAMASRRRRPPAKPATPKPAPAKPVPTPPPPAAPITDLVAALNRTRRANDKPAVFEMEQLDEAARIQAVHQADIDVCTHSGPLGLPWVQDRLAMLGVKYDLAGEICAQGPRVKWPDGSLAYLFDADKACDAWLDSPGHRAVLLDETMTHAGMFEVENDKGRIYFTAVFARNPRLD